MAIDIKVQKINTINLGWFNPTVNIGLSGTQAHANSWFDQRAWSLHAYRGTIRCILYVFYIK